MKKIFVVFSILVSISGFAIEGVTPDVIGGVNLESNPNFIGKLPEGKTDVLISRQQYIISYNRSRRLMNWAMWKIDSSDLGHVGRSNNFIQDQELENYLSKYNEHAVTPQDYYASCFDRGHQVPSADRDNSTDNNQFTFYMSNMIPQTAYLNRVIWEHLESYIRDVVKNQNKKVYIVAGPIFDDNFGTIGVNHDVPVPSKDFKMVYIVNPDQSPASIDLAKPDIAVVMPNVLKDGKNPAQDHEELCANSKASDLAKNKSVSSVDVNDWKEYQTNEREIETLSGFHFSL